MLVPGSVAQGYIFGIEQIIAQSYLTNTTNNRRLQVVDKRMIASAGEMSVPTISAIDPSTVAPTITYHNSQVMKMSKTTLPFSASTINAARPSALAQILRNASSTKNSFIVHPITVNASLYSYLMQADGIIDPSPNFAANLSIIGAISTTNTSKGSYIVPPQAAAAASIVPAAVPASIAPVIPSAT